MINLLRYKPTMLRAKSKIVSILLLITVSIISFYFWSKSTNSLPIVAITQIIEHVSLNQEREGIVNFLNEKGFIDGKNIKIIYRNAQGNLTTATQIANQLVSMQPKVLVAISTPSAQAALNSCTSNNVPLIFSAVTDPIAAKLVTTLGKRTENIGGATDHLPANVTFKLIKELMKNIKKVGVIYNSGEINSVCMVEELKQVAKELHIELIFATASKTGDVSGAAQSLIDKVEAIFIPTDNTAIASISSVNQVAEQAKIPVFTADIGSVLAGAMATRGYDRIAIGRHVGQIIIDILNGKKLSDIPVLRDHPLKTVFNRKTIKKIGFHIPSDILQKADVVGE